MSHLTHQKIPVRRYFVILLCLISLGCGSSKQLYPVHGSVFCDGAAAEGAVVTFFPDFADPEEKKTVGADWRLAPAATGIVQADGSYELTTFKPHDGARPGRYHVTISWFDPPQEGEVDYGPDKLGGKYATSEKSQITFDVEPGTNEVPAIEVKLAEAKK